MISSKNIDDLMPSVAANVKIFACLMAARGYKVAFACILRDQEKQTQLHNTIGAPSLVSFHWGGGKGKGLAFDIYQDEPTYEKQWRDAAFWKTARELLTLIGFSPVPGEESHSQWDDHKKYTSSMIRAGKLPGAMPLYKGDEDMYIEEIAKKANVTTAAVVDALAAYVKHANTAEDAWEDKAVQQLRADGVIGSDHPGNAPVFWGEFAAVVGKIK